MLPRPLRALAFALAFGLAPSVAIAAPSAKDRSEAKTLWTKGKRFAAQSKTDEAITALRAACELDPRAQYQLDLARALVSDGQLVEAREVAGAVRDTSEPNTQKAKQTAAQLITDLDARIPMVRVEVTGTGAGGAVVQIGTEEIERDREVPLDPGQYLVRAIGTKGERAEERLTLEERQRRTVRLELVVKSSGPAQASDERDDGKGTMVPALVAFGVGGVGVVLGSIFGVRAYQTTAEVEEICGGTTCPPKELENIELALEYGNVSTVAFAAGGVALAAGVVLAVTVGRDDPSEREQLSIRPVVGPGYAGVSGTF
jgi:hypothetical protein